MLENKRQARKHFYGLLDRCKPLRVSLLGQEGSHHDKVLKRLKLGEAEQNELKDGTLVNFVRYKDVEVRSWDLHEDRDEADAQNPSAALVYVIDFEDYEALREEAAALQRVLAFPSARAGAPLFVLLIQPEKDEEEDVDSDSATDEEIDLDKAKDALALNPNAEIGSLELSEKHKLFSFFSKVLQKITA